MDKQYIEKNEIEIKYLRNQLTEAEEEKYEIYLMENPDVIDQLSLDLTIQNAVRSQNFNLKKKLNNGGLQWRPRFAAISTVLSVLFLSSASMSFYSADKTIELYTVRSQAQQGPTYELTFGQRIWPLESEILLKPQIDRSVNYSGGKLIRLKPNESEHEIVKRYSAQQMIGAEAISVSSSILVPANYKLILEQPYAEKDNLDIVEIREWSFSFQVR